MRFTAILMALALSASAAMANGFYFVHKDGTPAKEYVGGMATGTTGTSKSWSSLGDSYIGQNGRRVQTSFNNIMPGQPFTLKYRAKGSKTWHTFTGRGGPQSKWHKVVVP